MSDSIKFTAAGAEAKKTQSYRRSVTIATGGRTVGERGYFYAPTIVANVDGDAEIARSEVFGPVITVSRYGDLDEGDPPGERERVRPGVVGLDPGRGAGHGGRQPPAIRHDLDQHIRRGDARDAVGRHEGFGHRLRHVSLFSRCLHLGAARHGGARMTGAFSGQTVVVTGGSRGIGRATVDAFVDAGAHVVTCGRGARPDDLPEEVAWHQADMAVRANVEALIEAAAHATDRRFSVLVNNAGVQVERNVVDSTDDDWEAVMGTNARGVFVACRAAIPRLAATGGGAIVNIGSISGNAADPQMALYNASKAFVHGLTRSIAVDHGRDGIRCNAICPGWIMTGMADAAFDLAKDPAAAKADALARHAAGRFGMPEDIARAVVWLASPQAAFVTGQTLTVDGGLTAATPLQPGLF